MTDVDVEIDEAELRRFCQSMTGPVAELIVRLSRDVGEGAKVRAPVGDRDSKYGHPAGWLRSQIGWTVDRESGEITGTIISPAKNSEANPFTPGGDYAYWNEVPGTAPHHASLPEWITSKEGPYLVPALEAVIRSL